MIFLFPETQCPKKNGNTVASLVIDILKRRKYSFDDLIIFADNAASQNKNIFLFSANLFGCRIVRLCFMVAGHTKLRPDSWFGLLKLDLLHKNVNSILDIKESVLNTGIRSDGRALGIIVHTHVPVWTSRPFTRENLVKTYDFGGFIRNYRANMSGNSVWYDV